MYHAFIHSIKEVIKVIIIIIIIILNILALNLFQNVTFTQSQCLLLFSCIFQNGFDRIKENLEKSYTTMNLLRVLESRDRSIQEDNFSRVNLWSGIQLFVMISVAITQVLMIRSLFDDKSAVAKIMKIRT